MASLARPEDVSGVQIDRLGTGIQAGGHSIGRWAAHSLEFAISKPVDSCHSSKSGGEEGAIQVVECFDDEIGTPVDQVQCVSNSTQCSVRL